MPKKPPLVARILAESRATNPIDRFVLVAIASHVGENDCAWPSYGTIATETGCSTRTVKRSVRRLAGRGDDEDRLEEPELLIDVHGGRVAGRPKQHQPNAFRIILGGEPVTGKAASGDTRDTSSGDPVTPLVVTPVQISGDREGQSVVTPVTPKLKEELQENNSLSSVDNSTVVAIDRGRESNIVHDALVLIAERRVQGSKAAGVQIRNKRAYGREVLADATDEWADELTMRATNNPTWTAEDLAEQVEPKYGTRYVQTAPEARQI